MAIPRRKLALDALYKAEALRRTAQIDLGGPAPVFDVAESMDLHVRFDRLPGIDGFYDGERRLILISALRPPGRQAFTCAHEIAHHVYGHGQYVLLPDADSDSASGARRTEPEFLADRFASFLLMPKIAVRSGFKRRGWDPQDPTPRQIYEVAGWLGVGYTTLVYHMRATLRLLDSRNFNELLSVQPKDIRRRILGEGAPGDLFLVNRAWTGRAVDMQVRDLILAPPQVLVEGDALEVIESDKSQTLVSARRSGLARLHDENGWAAFARVSKKEYVGISAYRHWPDPDEDTNNAE